MKKKEKQEVLDIREDIPIRRYDKQKKCFQRENGSYSNLYQIIPRDLVNSDVDEILSILEANGAKATFFTTGEWVDRYVDEIEMDCFKWAKFLKIYGLDIEIISMMFPCNTHTQQEYWKKRMRNNTNPLYHEMIKRKLAELEYREKHAVTKQFFIQVFFADDNERKESIRLIDSILGIVPEEERRTGMEILKEIPEKKKRQILYKLGNKNSRIF